MGDIYKVKVIKEPDLLFNFKCDYLRYNMSKIIFDNKYFYGNLFLLSKF